MNQKSEIIYLKIDISNVDLILKEDSLNDEKYHSYSSK